jgi:dolichol-phosphate mannosyltransferase
MTVDRPSQSELLEPKQMALSIIIPTYNESQNIAGIIDSIAKSIPGGMAAEVIVVDDNSPDGTADIVAGLARELASDRLHIQVVRRASKQGLSSAILAGVESSCGQIVIVMDGDFSHPPQTIPHMVEELYDRNCDIVVASRYVHGGSIIGWPFKRKLMSRGATRIAQMGLGIEIKDPMSGFFAFRRKIISEVRFDAIGYKMLLEMLVKLRGVKVREIPYTFTNRTLGASKVNASVMYDYLRAVYRLYRYGRSTAPPEQRTSVRFLSKAGRFYTVGASGLLINYVASLMLNQLFPSLWYLHSTLIGIVLSMTSNFVLNKIWTFEDRNFERRRTAIQYLMFMGFSSIGALLQLSIVYLLYDGRQVDYPIALVVGVIVASVGNFLLNKKLTFKEKVWG